jgi:hypothetical protein
MHFVAGYILTQSPLYSLVGRQTLVDFQADFPEPVQPGYTEQDRPSASNDGEPIVARKHHSLLDPFSENFRGKSKVFSLREADAGTQRRLDFVWAEFRPERKGHGSLE